MSAINVTVKKRWGKETLTAAEAGVKVVMIPLPPENSRPIPTGFTGSVIDLTHAEEADVRFPNEAPSLNRALEYLEVKTSRNSDANWPGPQGARVPGLVLTKDRKEFIRPTEPVYRRPRLRSVIEPLVPVLKTVNVPQPKRRRNESDFDFFNRTQRWTAKTNKLSLRNLERDQARYKRIMVRVSENRLINARRLAAYDATFQKRVAKYKATLTAYERAVERASKPQFSRFACYATPPDRPDNPYSLVKMTFKDPEHSIRQYRSTENNYPAFDQIHNNNGVEYTLAGIWYIEYMGTRAAIWKTLQWSSLTNAQAEMYINKIKTQVLSAANMVIFDAEQKVIRKIHSKIKRQVMHVGNILAERKQTFDLIQSTYKRIFQLIKLKRNIFKAVGSALLNPRQLASDILAFKFGVEPMIGEITALIERFDESSDNLLVRVSSNFGVLPKEVIEINTPDVTFSGEVVLSYVVKCTNSEPLSNELSRFGLINPLEIAWEVLPWSFVVDWFLPVGDWISSQTSDVGLDFKTGTRKIKLTGDFEIKGASSTRDPWPRATENTGIMCKFSGEINERTVLNEMPERTFPAFKNPLTLWHEIEAIALAVQRLPYEKKPKRVNLKKR